MSATTIAVRLLLADGGVAAMVGQRIYPVLAPQDADHPHIVVTVISERQDFVIAGAQRAFTNRIAVACIGETATAVDAIGEAVKSALEDIINETVTDGESPPASWLATVWKASTDLFDYTEARTVYRRLIDWNLRWTEAA